MTGIAGTMSDDPACQQATTFFRKGGDFYSNSPSQGRRVWAMRSISCVVLLLAFLPRVFGGLVWDVTQREIHVPLGQKEVLTEFPFRNPNPDPVEILSLQTSCGCTLARVDKKQIAPGESAAVHVRFDIGNRKGEQIKSIIVKSSDQIRQGLILRVWIQDPVSFSEKEFVWKVGEPGVGKPTLVEVHSSARILGVESLSDQFEARLEEVKAGAQYRIVATPRSTAGPMKGAIKVLIADPGKRSVILRARVEE